MEYFLIVINAFEIRVQNAEILFFDQYKTPIRSMDLLNEVLRQYGNDSSFVLKVDFKVKDDGIFTSVVIFANKIS